MFVCLHVCLCATFVPVARGGQERALNPPRLDMQVQTVVNTMEVLETKARFSEGTVNNFNQ